MDESHNRLQVILAGLALAGTAYFAVAIAVLHFLRPDLSPISQPTSAYAVGPYDPLMTSAFLALSLASWALVLGLWTVVSASWQHRIGLALLGLWAVGLIIAAVFPIDLDGTAPTLAGIIHRINGPLTFLCLTAGVLLVSRSLQHDERWRPFHPPAQYLSFAVLAAFVVGALTVPTNSGFVGLAQRLLIAAFVAWFIFMSTRFRRLALNRASVFANPPS